MVGGGDCAPCRDAAFSRLPLVAVMIECQKRQYRLCCRQSSLHATDRAARVLFPIGDEEGARCDGRQGERRII